MREETQRKYKRKYLMSFIASQSELLRQDEGPPECVSTAIHAARPAGLERKYNSSLTADVDRGESFLRKGTRQPTRCRKEMMKAKPAGIRSFGPCVRVQTRTF